MTILGPDGPRPSRALLREAASQANRAAQQIAEGYSTLSAITPAAARLARVLHRENRQTLAGAASLAASVARQQAILAAERGWLPRRVASPLDAEPWMDLEASEAAWELYEQFRGLALHLLDAADLAPETWETGAIRTAGNLLLVAAQLREALLETEADG